MCSLKGGCDLQRTYTNRTVDVPQQIIGTRMICSVPGALIISEKGHRGLTNLVGRKAGGKVFSKLRGENTVLFCSRAYIHQHSWGVSFDPFED